ncbi:MAG: DUF4872 domain-containing protein [Candidatus Helarchaeota archaeon]
MSNPPIRNLGLARTLKFKEIVKSWIAKFDNEKLLFILINTWIYNQTGGTGGALFRTMYSQFLGEAYEIIGNNFLKRVKEILTDVSEAWNKVAQYLLPDDLQAIKEIKNIFREINKMQ